jgi:hypothetical protein
MLMRNVALTVQEFLQRGQYPQPLKNLILQMFGKNQSN